MRMTTRRYGKTLVGASALLLFGNACAGSSPPAPAPAQPVPGAAIVDDRVLSMPEATAEQLQDRHCLAGCPDGAADRNELVTREIYVLNNNPETKFADWLAYQILAEDIGPTQNRVWKADPLLPASSTLEPDDYRGANAALRTDRGHQAPLASFTSTDDWRDTNFLSNITPQRAALNQGPWLGVESAVRGLARMDGGTVVHVMTGPLYERQMPPLPGADEPHSVPSGYWKIVATQDGNGTQVAAFIFDQDTPRDADICEYVETVAEVERRSGLDFFHALPDAAETTLESGPSALSAKLGCADPA